MSEGRDAFLKPEEKSFVGFRLVEIPLGLVRNMVQEGMGGPGAQRLVDEHPFESNFTAVQVNEFDNSLTLVKDADGGYKQLERSK
jgi:hypothetical protein